MVKITNEERLYRIEQEQKKIEDQLTASSNNTVEAFKALVGWIRDTVPEEAVGSYEKVNAWCGINPEQRRIILEQYRLIYTNQEEVWKILQDEKSVEPVLY